jgi:hypothetical protein
VSSPGIEYFYEEQIRACSRTGIQDRREAGYFDGRPIGEGAELIFVCGQ